MTRIAIAQFMQESHSFTTIPCTWKQFEAGHIYRRDDILRNMHNMKVEVGGAIAVAQQHEVQLLPLIACNAVSSGYIQQDVFTALFNDLLERLQASLPVDGVFIALHGATVTERDEDACGTILASIRQIVGENIPIVATLDLHANVTQKMVDSCDALIGYHTCPHVDLFETGEKAMKLLLDMIAGHYSTTTAYYQLPMILPAEKSVTLDGPFREVMEYVIALEREPEVLSASAFYVQPWLDLSDVGCSVIVITQDNQALADRLAKQIADKFWQKRTECTIQLTPLKEAVREAMDAPKGPVILSDGADAPSGGASGIAQPSYKLS